MKKLFFGLIAFIWFINACAPTTTNAPIAVTPNASATLSPLPTVTATQTPLPSSTPTASITPLPTIPTFTPTFDARTIVTVTPAPKVVCPKEDPSVIATFATPNSDGAIESSYDAPEVSAYLNAGGISDHLQKSGLEKTADLTGDGLHELVYKNFAYSFFGCKDGHYQNLLYFVGDFGAELAGILDLNKNGIPEIILYNLVHYGYVDISIFEWDGNKFRSLINRGKYSSDDPAVIDFVSGTWMPNDTYYKLIDTNGDGLQEIMVVFDRLCGGFGDPCDGTPRRALTTILAWNGQNYVKKQKYYSPAQYRFQAIQDGDDASAQKEYDKALSLYQAAIFSDKLKSYSPAISDNLRAQYNTQYSTTPTPTPYPISSDEYPKLAAYAYFRIVLLHLAQNHEPEATTVYDTLQKKFGSDPYGRPYVEMATAFWEAYQSTHKMYNGCAAAIQYATEHPEILTPLGSDYHGSQSHLYVPADVCPFR